MAQSGALFTPIGSTRALERISRRLLTTISFHKQGVHLVNLAINGSPRTYARYIRLQFSFKRSTQGIWAAFHAANNGAKERGAVVIWGRAICKRQDPYPVVKFLMVYTGFHEPHTPTKRSRTSTSPPSGRKVDRSTGTRGSARVCIPSTTHRPPHPSTNPHPTLRPNHSKFHPKRNYQLHVPSTQGKPINKTSTTLLPTTTIHKRCTTRQRKQRTPLLQAPFTKYHHITPTPRENHHTRSQANGAHNTLREFRNEREPRNHHQAIHHR